MTNPKDKTNRRKQTTSLTLITNTELITHHLLYKLFYSTFKSSRVPAESAKFFTRKTQYIKSIKETSVPSEKRK